MLHSHHIFLKQKCSLNQAWKEGRGIWHDQTNNLLILINEEEHIKIISHQSGDDLFHVFEKLGALLLEIESLLMRNGYEFMRNVNYGYLASRLQELGTSLRVSVNVNIPLIAKVSNRRISSIVWPEGGFTGGGGGGMSRFRIDWYLTLLFSVWMFKHCTPHLSCLETNCLFDCSSFICLSNLFIWISTGRQAPIYLEVLGFAEEKVRLGNSSFYNGKEQDTAALVVYSDIRKSGSTFRYQISK